MLKIISGEFRSRILASPPDAAVTRPYGGRVLESVFNHLRGWFEDARVLDLFAGVGTVGLEAISRGARQVVLFEQDRRIFRLLQENIESLGCGDRATAVCADALSQAVFLRAPDPVDLVFLDPPYAMMRTDVTRDRVLAQAARCARIMARPSFLVLRSPLGPDELELEIPGLDGPEAHPYGRAGERMWILFYAPESGDAPDPANA